MFELVSAQKKKKAWKEKESDVIGYNHDVLMDLMCIGRERVKDDSMLVQWKD